jgi:hypothetical protein
MLHAAAAVVSAAFPQWRRYPVFFHAPQPLMNNISMDISAPALHIHTVFVRLLLFIARERL